MQDEILYMDSQCLEFSLPVSKFYTLFLYHSNFHHDILFCSHLQDLGDL